MCGIVGVFGSGVQRHARELRAATQKLAHRGPDAEGVYRDSHCLLGNRRLAIVDLRARANQPMRNRNRTVVVTFNGELYNLRELRAELEQGGYRFRTTSDTECVIAAYERYGERCMEKFVGMFAFALYDRKRKRLLLARDRIGEKPLFYSRVGEKLFFASELQALLTFRSIDRTLSLPGLHAYFAYAHIPPPLTIFRSIAKLLPGHYLIAEGGTQRVVRYWNVRTGGAQVSFRAAAAQCRKLLSDAVRAQLVADVPVGVLLSSGVDSNAITAIAKEHQHDLQTFTIGLKTETFEDMEYQRALAAGAWQGVAQNHLSYDFSRVHELPKLLLHYGEPMNHYASLSLWVLLDAVRRKGLKVVLAGNGADELMGGYEGYTSVRWLLRITALLHWLPSPVVRLLLSMFRLPAATAALIAERDPKRWRYLSAQLAFDRNCAQLFLPAVRENSKLEDVIAPLREVADLIESRNPMQTLYLLDLLSYHAHGVTTAADTCGMAHGVEVRNPFLDHRLVEYIATLPVRYKTTLFRKRRNKRVLKRAMEKFLPKHMLYAQKLTFGNYISAKRVLGAGWYPLMHEVLLQRYLPKLNKFRMDRIAQMLDAYRDGEERHDHLLWGLFCFELWYEVVVLEKSPTQVWPDHSRPETTRSGSGTAEQHAARPSA